MSFSTHVVPRSESPSANQTDTKEKRKRTNTDDSPVFFFIVSFYRHGAKTNEGDESKT